jgi:plastocyanin
MSVRQLAAVAAAAVASLSPCAVASAAMPMREAMRAAPASARTAIALHERVVRIEIRNFAFTPARLVVSAGTRVVWQNHDGDPHTVRTYGRGFASPAIVTNGQFAVVLGTPGTYAYYCAIHPFMHGVVVVRR